MRGCLRFFAISVVLFFLLGCSLSQNTPCPTDKDLITFFNANKSGFEKLARDYQNKELLEELGISGANVISTDPLSITFEVWGEDFPGSGGCRKGYAYFAIPPKKLVHSIDTVTFPGTPEEKEFHRRIGQTWYIYYISSK